MSGSNEVFFDMDWGEVPPEPSPPAEPVPLPVVAVVTELPTAVGASPDFPQPTIAQDHSVDRTTPPPTLPNSFPAVFSPPPLSRVASESPPPPPLPSPATPPVASEPIRSSAASAKALVRGQRADLSKLGLSEGDTVLELCVKQGAAPIQLVCAGLGATDSVFDSGYFVNSRVVKFPCGSVTLQGPFNGAQRLRFDLTKAPSGLHRIIVGGCASGWGKTTHVSGTLAFQTAGNSIANYAFDGANCDAAEGVFLAELYLRQGNWRLYIPGEPVPRELSELVKCHGL